MHSLTKNYAELSLYYLNNKHYETRLILFNNALNKQKKNLVFFKNKLRFILIMNPIRGKQFSSYDIIKHKRMRKINSVCNRVVFLFIHLLHVKIILFLWSFLYSCS